MSTIHHQLWINAPVAKVYEAIATADGIYTWWDKQTPIQTDRGLILEHNPGPEHGVVKLRVVALVPNQRINWECVSTHSKSSPASAWTGTRFTFEMAEGGNGADSPRSGPNQHRNSTVDFCQEGYDERSEFFAANKLAWGHVLNNLKRVIEAQRI